MSGVRDWDVQDRRINYPVADQIPPASGRGFWGEFFSIAFVCYTKFNEN